MKRPIGRWIGWGLLASLLAAAFLVWHYEQFTVLPRGKGYASLPAETTTAQGKSPVTRLYPLPGLLRAERSIDEQRVLDATLCMLSLTDGRVIPGGLILAATPTEHRTIADGLDKLQRLWLDSTLTQPVSVWPAQDPPDPEGPEVFTRLYPVADLLQPTRGRDVPALLDVLTTVQQLWLVPKNVQECGGVVVLRSSIQVHRELEGVLQQIRGALGIADAREPPEIDDDRVSVVRCYLLPRLPRGWQKSPMALVLQDDKRWHTSTFGECLVVIADRGYQQVVARFVDVLPQLLADEAGREPISVDTSGLVKPVRFYPIADLLRSASDAELAYLAGLCTRERCVVYGSWIGVAGNEAVQQYFERILRMLRDSPTESFVVEPAEANKEEMLPLRVYPFVDVRKWSQADTEWRTDALSEQLQLDSLPTRFPYRLDWHPAWSAESQTGIARFGETLFVRSTPSGHDRLADFVHAVRQLVDGVPVSGSVTAIDLRPLLHRHPQVEPNIIRDVIEATIDPWQRRVDGTSSGFFGTFLLLRCTAEDAQRAAQAIRLLEAEPVVVLNWTKPDEQVQLVDRARATREPFARAVRLALLAGNGSLPSDLWYEADHLPRPVQTDAPDQEAILSAYCRAFAGFTRRDIADPPRLVAVLEHLLEHVAADERHRATILASLGRSAACLPVLARQLTAADISDAELNAVCGVLHELHMRGQVPLPFLKALLLPPDREYLLRAIDSNWYPRKPPDVSLKFEE